MVSKPTPANLLGEALRQVLSNLRPNRIALADMADDLEAIVKAALVSIDEPQSISATASAGLPIPPKDPFTPLPPLR